MIFVDIIASCKINIILLVYYYATILLYFVYLCSRPATVYVGVIRYLISTHTRKSFPDLPTFQTPKTRLLNQNGNV